jgi:ADP-ribosylglycohydrolase
VSHDLDAIERSAVWAAWGDALGFITELAGASEVRRRAGASYVDDLVVWQRRVGGRQGATVELPAGALSDDTLLRFAVGRCIRSNGRFDADAFTKVELPTFLAYELGAGRGTKAAARAYTKRGTRFYNSFWEDNGSRYVDGGGNGAAMRIQPHVWAAREHHPDDFVAGVLLDAITTHGHPRGFLAAVFHALCLSDVLRQDRLPDAQRARDLARYLLRVPAIIESNELLREQWLPRWNQQAGISVEAAVRETVGEITEALEVVHGRYSLSIQDDYPQLVRMLGGHNPKTRGAGTITAVLALALAQRFTSEPAGGLAFAVNELGSDTDTIATMAGALLGPLVPEMPRTRPMDFEYIKGEARRLFRISRGEPAEDFPHPDPLTWSPPRRQVDVVVLSDEALHVLGLGPVEELSGLWLGGGRNSDSGWQWVRTSFGQSILVKRRLEPETRGVEIEPSLAMGVFDSPLPSRTQTTDEDGAFEVMVALREARESGLDDAVIGRLVKRLGTQAPYFVALLVDEIRGQPDSGGGALRLRSVRPGKV